MWLCPAGIREDFIHVENSIEECLHIFLPGKPFDEALLKDLDIDPSGIEIRYESIDRDPFIEFVANQILKEMEVESSTGRLLDRKPRKRAVGPSGARLCGDGRSPETIARRRTKPLDPKRLSRVTDFINASVERDFTVNELASVACMSPAHFSRSFKAATGHGAARICQSATPRPRQAAAA